MEVFVIIVSVLIGLIFFSAGSVKLYKSYEKPEERAKWTSEKSIVFIRIISWSEIIGAILFVIPELLNIIPFISILAALVLTILMIGAPISHLKLGEHKEAALTTSILILMLLVTFVRAFA